MTPPTQQAVLAELSKVLDPEIRRPITDLDMVAGIEIADDGATTITLLLTTAGCPLKDTLIRDSKAAAEKVPGIGDVTIDVSVMDADQREALRLKLRGAEPTIPFAQPDSLTRVYAVASGKGGVGKSSVTANLAAALAADGLSVGVIDADIYGFSVPRMLGVTTAPTQVDDMMLPVIAHDVKVMSIGMLVPAGRPVVWRGPMLHRALQQFLTDVFWGDLDVLLLDLPPGTGDIAISVAQLLPNAELLVVTTPQAAAAEVAQRAGAMALQTKQQIVGVVENMSWLEQPDGSRLEVFGTGGGEQVAKNLSTALGAQVPLLGQIPLDVTLREGGDCGEPVVVAHPDSPAAVALKGIADTMAHRSRGLAGRSLGVTPVSR